MSLALRGPLGRSCELSVCDRDQQLATHLPNSFREARLMRPVSF